ncbi:hypothetical protein B0H13DRAFT_1738745 [Mycena leptocephala]|nr:hypothetical protein B0H13DRAFT_1738745 [Mycena leptocephala]
MNEELQLTGEFVLTECSTAALLMPYINERDPLSGDNPAADLEAMHPRHYLRRSARIRDHLNKKNKGMITPAPPPSTPKRPPNLKRPRPPAAALDQREPAMKKWIDAKGKLIVRNVSWRESELTQQPFSNPESLDSPKTPTAEKADSVETAKPKRKHHRSSAGCKVRRGKPNPQKKIERVMGKSQILTADGFSLVKDASFSQSGWQGAPPPDIAKIQIDRMYYQKPNAAALHPHLCTFHPAGYTVCEDIRKEQATIFCDRDGQIFMYRSFRAGWLMEMAAEVEHAHNVLVGDDLSSNTIKGECRLGMRGPHMPIIIGHQRQSCTKPRLTAWHEHNEERTEEFINLPVIQRIIGHVSTVVETVFPGVAARFKSDAKFHKERYNIEPRFGLFWNLCLNAWFRGQRRIHCGPHADRKNQIGVCLLLIYVLKCGVNFNHTQRTWLVIWEAVVIVELPPWTLAMYPSSLFYHFNVDVHDIEFVTTEGNARPTRENSRPIVEGDDQGRGSFVFFNQSTMCQGPATGYDTMIEAVENGHSGKVDYGESIQDAFTRLLVLTPISPEMLK